MRVLSEWKIELVVVQLVKIPNVYLNMFAVFAEFAHVCCVCSCLLYLLMFAVVTRGQTAY